MFSRPPFILIPSPPGSDFTTRTARFWLAIAASGTAGSGDNGAVRAQHQGHLRQLPPNFIPSVPEQHLHPTATGATFYHRHPSSILSSDREETGEPHRREETGEETHTRDRKSVV